MVQALPETLRKMMTAVSETEKENPPLWGMGMVAVTILVQFMYTLAQKQLSVLVLDTYTDAYPSIITIILACIQVAAAACVFRVSGLNFSTSTTNREVVITGVIAYIGGLFLQNYLLWSKETSASACYGVQEPLVCILLLYAAACIPTDPNRTGAVVCVCLGAALLTTELTLIGDTRALLCVLASIFMLARNMVTKHLYDSSVSFTLRSQDAILTLAAGVIMVTVVASFVICPALLMASLMMVLTGVLSVTLLHLVLKLLSLYDTLTVALFMLWAQVLENTIVVTDVSRPGVLSVILGAALFAAGNYAYFKDGLESGTVHLNIKQVGVNELFTRLQFVLYAGFIVGLTVTLLQPTISERDMEALSYVGLDRIARRLLNIHHSQH